MRHDLKPLVHGLVLAWALSGLQASAKDAKTTTGTVSAADGATIAYEVRGTGDVALVFIHGWACDRAYWRGQLKAFAGDYRVVALDLGGHGQSSKDRETWSIAGLGGDVEAVADKLGLERMILVGHSMGGPVALEAARRMSGRVIGVVGVDTLHDVTMKPPQEMMDQIQKQYETDFGGTMTTFIRSMFSKDAEPTLVHWVAKRASAVDPGPALAFFRDFPNLDLEEMLAAAGVPVRCINAAPTASNPETQVETNRRFGDFDATLMEGVGHFLQLEKRDEFNGLLREVLTEMTAR